MTSADHPPLARAAVANMVGVAENDVREWQRLGLIHETAEGSFDETALERARFVKFAIDRGIDVATLARVSHEQQDLVGRSVELAGGGSGLGRSLEEAAELVGLDAGAARHIWAASGLDDQGAVFEEDLALLRTVVGALEMGFPIDALRQILRVYADASGRIAEAETRLFHLHVHERMRHQGRIAAEVADATKSLSDPLVALIEPTLLYFHGKAWARAIREDLLLHLRQEAMPPGAVGELPVVVLFVDLASFTPFVEAAGDAAAAAVLDRFSELVRNHSGAHHGQVIKQIGDEFMVVFDSPSDAVHCGIAVQHSAATDPDIIGIRAGAHAGTALYREADYLGATVNLAARVAGEAARGQLIVTDSVRSGANWADIEFEPLGERNLKGIQAPVALFAASPSEPR